MTKDVKNNGTYDGRTKGGFQSKGKTLQPKAIVRKVENALKNKNKHGKNFN